MNIILNTIILATRMSKNPWMNRLFSALRMEVVEQSGTLISLAMLIASTIVVIKLIRMTYTIAADERTGGFGGVTLWEIARPIIILVCIMNSQFLLSSLDGICDGIATRIVNSSDKMQSRQVLASLLSQMEVSETRIKEAALLKDKALKQEDSTNNAILAEIATKGALGRDKDGNPLLVKGMAYLSREQVKETNKWMAFDPAMQPVADSLSKIIQDNQGLSKSISRAVQDYQGASAKLIKDYKEKMDGLDDPRRQVGPKTFLTSITTWLCDEIYLWMMGYCDIYLCCLAFMFPITLAISLVEKWKGAIWTFLGSYITISMWKVTNAIINMVVSKSYLAAVAAMGDIYIEGVSNLDTELLAAKANTASVIAMTVAVAGIIATLSIPKITSTIMSIGAGGDDHGASQTGGAIFGAAGKILGTGGKFVSH